MDLFKTSKYFDTTKFLEYDFLSSSWVDRGFIGQVKKADNFVSIWNRPTRKRMIYSQVDVPLTSTVVKVVGTGEILIVGSSQDDVHSSKGYRRVYNAHEAFSTAEVRRKTSPIVGGKKDFAVDSLVETTFGDYELRATDRLKDEVLLGHGEYFLFLPSNSSVSDLDEVIISGHPFVVYEVARDSGLVSCRATSKPDDRRNFVYKEIVADVYDPSTQTFIPTFESYNSTGKVLSVEDKIDYERDENKEEYMIVIRNEYISYVPKVGSKVDVFSNTYTVLSVKSDSLREEWKMRIG